MPSKRSLVSSPDEPPRNQLLQDAPPGDRALFLSVSETVSLRRGDTLGAGQAAPICFPTTAVLSVTDRGGLEVGVVGPEGMTGWTMALSGFQHPLPAVVDQPGTAQILSAADLRRVCIASAAIRAAIFRFAVVMTAQMAATIIATARHQAGRRLARRLLMIHDRADCDNLAATHLQLSRAMGARRATVTDCLHLLESERVLRCTRSAIEVLDREALERWAGPAYGSAERAHRRIDACSNAARVAE